MRRFKGGFWTCRGPPNYLCEVPATKVALILTSINSSYVQQSNTEGVGLRSGIHNPLLEILVATVGIDIDFEHAGKHMAQSDFQ